MQVEIKSGTLWLKVQGCLYNEAVLYKCFYWYGRHYRVAITKEGDDFQITLDPKESFDKEGPWDKVIDQIKQDLIDFKLRALVNEETKTIRELLVAKAFAYYETDNGPSTNVSDPVGFDPHLIKLYE